MSIAVGPSGLSYAAFSLDELNLGWFITSYAEQISVPREASHHYAFATAIAKGNTGFHQSGLKSSLEQF